MSLRTLDRRLKRDRELLRRWLARRGLRLSTVMRATGLSQQAGHAAHAVSLEAQALLQRLARRAK